MARRALLAFNILWLAVSLTACTEKQTEYKIIPDILLPAGSSWLQHQQGILYCNGVPFSGRVFSLFANGDTAQIAPYYQGREEGWMRAWYEGGARHEERFFVAGKKEGIHKSWWPNGQLKFSYHFTNDEHEGAAKEWYSNGKPSRFFHYKKGQEDGLQQLWWEDGTLRANYVVKEGQQYGMVGRKLCKNTLDEVQQ